MRRERDPSDHAGHRGRDECGCGRDTRGAQGRLARKSCAIVHRPASNGTNGDGALNGDILVTRGDVACLYKVWDGDGGTVCI